MTTAKSFEFITLDTGSKVMSPRSAVNDQVIAVIQKALSSADGRLGAGWSVRMKGRRPEAMAWDMLYNGKPLSACFMALGDESMWDVVDKLIPDNVVLARPRGFPWLAVKMLPGYFEVVLKTPQVALELGDAERCVAWALIEGGAS